MTPPGDDGSFPEARVPPHNYGAEQALLGAVMVNNRVLDRVNEFLRAEHFADPVHGRIFEACSKLIERGQIASPITLKAIFEQDQSLTDLGGMPYLTQMVGSVATIINAEDYGRLIFDLYLRREMITAGESLVADAYDVVADRASSDVMETHDSAMQALVETGRSDRPGLRSAGGFAADILGQWEATGKGEQVGVTTGAQSLNRQMLGGMRPGQLYILAGRPGMGKTAVAGTIALAAARSGVSVAFFSLEMPGAELAGRLVANIADLDYERAQFGNLDQDEWIRCTMASTELEGLPLRIDDTGAQTMAAIRAQCRRQQRKGLGLAIIDHLGLLKSTGPKSQNRTHQIEELTTGFKALSKELGIPVLLLSQLSRACEMRDDKRPQLADLRDSGSIEQDADTVMFVYREQYYLEKSEPARRGDEDQGKFDARYVAWTSACQRAHNTAEVIIPKIRQGKTGSVRLFCDLSRMRIGDLAHSEGEN